MGDDTRRDELRERLLRAETPRSEIREHYEREVQSMFEEKITGWKKTLHVFMAISTLCMAVLFVAMIYDARSEAPLVTLLAFGLGALFSGAWVVLMVRNLWRGRVDKMSQSRNIAGMTWGFVVIMMTMFMVQAGKNPDSISSVFMVVTGLVFFVMGGVFLIVQRIEQSELKTREKLLEMELRLAEIADAVKSRG